MTCGDYKEVFTPGERLKMRSWMDEIYGVFKGHVTAIRGNRLKKPIDDLAGGRVYTGKQALELGLVDRLGTLHDAVKHVAAQAKLTDYDVRVVPKPKSFLERLLEDSADNDSRKGLDVVHKPTLPELAQPYLRSLDPTRAELVRTAFGRSSLLNREGVILMMPELDLDIRTSRAQSASVYKEKQLMITSRSFRSGALLGLLSLASVALPRAEASSQRGNASPTTRSSPPRSRPTTRSPSASSCRKQARSRWEETSGRVGS